jgi:hypothetical protein
VQPQALRVVAPSSMVSQFDPHSVQSVKKPFRSAAAHAGSTPPPAPPVLTLDSIEPSGEPPPFAELAVAAPDPPAPPEPPEPSPSLEQPTSATAHIHNNDVL